MEAVHDVFDLYLWLSYRFPDMFPDVEIVRSIQLELDSVIQEGKKTREGAGMFGGLCVVMNDVDVTLSLSFPKYNVLAGLAKIYYSNTKK